MERVLKKIAICVAFISAMELFNFPGGLSAAIIGEKIDLGVWVFIVADITAFSISMAVLIAGMTVGPKSREKINRRAAEAMLIAVLAMGIAVHQSFDILLRDFFWLRLIHRFGFVLFGLTCVFDFILPSAYRTK